MKFYLTILISVLTVRLYSQTKSANNWYFGNKAAITFNTQQPSFLSGNEMNNLKHSSCISDYDGNLLFYTNGVIVWDKNNDIMPNGGGLYGNMSLPIGERVIIIPHPGNINLYYIFCVNMSGLYYSVVDMSQNDGSGDVLNEKKNIFVESDIRYYMTAVGNKNRYWLLVQRGGANQGIRSYQIDSSGFNRTAIMNNVSSNTDNKFTPSGRRVAVNNGELGVIVYDFDMQTGILDNPLIFLPDGTNNILSMAFSQNERFLYVNNKYSQIIQYDLLAGTPTDIVNSAFIVYEDAENGRIHDLQLGIDGKIYVSIYGSSYLAAINTPNLQGLACSFDLQVVNLGDATANYGLPIFVQNFFLPREIEILTSGICLYEQSVFQVSSSENIQSILWNFGDNQTSAELLPTHIYENAGKYTVRVEITYTDNTTETITKKIEIFEKPEKLKIMYSE